MDTPEADLEIDLEIDVDLDVAADGARVSGDAQQRAGRITLRRLSEHAFWVESGGYHSTVVVGTSSVLILDPLSGGRGEGVRNAVSEVFGLAPSAIVYSHAHRDHADDAAALIGSAARGAHIEVIATQACADRVARTAGLVRPTRVLANYETFDFDGVAIEARVVGGHTDDSTWYRLPDEGVLHMVDLIHPAQAEFDSFGMAPSLTDYRSALECALHEDWRVLTAGHGQLGWRDDVRQVLAYLDEVTDFVSEALAANPSVRFTDPHRHGYAAIQARLEAVQEQVVERLAPRWGALPGFDVAVASHVKRVFLEQAYFA
jgi:glyoxylase-like metal-dependent hydrolase (beta-lactamase superfamily II)